MCEGIEYKFSIIEEGIHEVVFTYGSDNTRKKYVYKQSGTIKKTKIYAGGGYEKVMENGNTKEWYFIPGPDGVAAIYERINGVTSSMYYIHKDHLGSYMTITNSTGNLVEEYSYDALGRMRQPIDWSDYSVSNDLIFDRGYTGHEHFPMFGLIHMYRPEGAHGNTIKNKQKVAITFGRMYDPLLGRVLSPDNYVQNPFFSQNYNRYS